MGQLFRVEAWLAEEGAPPHPDGLWATRVVIPSDALSKEVADGRT